MSRLGQIKQTFKSVRIEIKAFLRRQQWKEALISEFRSSTRMCRQIYLSRKHRPKPLQSK